MKTTIVAAAIAAASLSFSLPAQGNPAPAWPQPQPQPPAGVGTRAGAPPSATAAAGRSAVRPAPDAARIGAAATAAPRSDVGTQEPARSPRAELDKEPAWVTTWREFRARHPEAAEHILRSCDRNGDGRLADGERLFVRERMHHLRAEMREERSEELPQRWEEFQLDHPEVATRLKQDSDRNGDGVLDDVERQHMLETFRQQRQAEAQQRWHDFAQQHPEAAARIAQRTGRAGDGLLVVRDRQVGDSLTVIQEREGALGEGGHHLENGRSDARRGDRGQRPRDEAAFDDLEAARERTRLRELQAARESEEPWVEIKGNGPRSPGKGASSRSRRTGPPARQPARPKPRPKAPTRPNTRR